MPGTVAEKSFSVFHDPSISAVVMQWKGYFTSEEFRSGTAQMLETLKTFKSDRVLADVRDMVLISMDDQRWMQTFFLPEAIAAGFKACALVQPVNYFNKVAIGNIKDNIDRTRLIVELFDTIEEARQWLKTMEINE